MTLQQLKQVGMTYVTQRYLWWVAGLLSIAVAPSVVVSATSRGASADAAQPLMMSLGMPMLCLIAFLAAQAKSQFAHARSRLVPGYYPPHLAALCGVFSAMLLVYPFALAQMSGLEPLGVIAFGIAMAAPAIWGAHLNRILPMLVALVVFYSFMTDWGLRWWVVDAAAHRTEHALIVLAGVALIGAWLWRLCQLKEEMDDYQGFHQLMMARRSGGEVIEQRRVIARQMRRSQLVSWIGDRWHARLGGYYGGGRAGLARLLRYGFAPHPAEVQGLFMCAMFIAMVVFLTQFSYFNSGTSGFGAAWFLIIFAILLPGQMAGETMAQRRPRIAFELLLPVRRDRLIDGLFSAANRNSVVLWLVLNGGVALIVPTMRVSVDIGTATMFLLLSAATMFASLAFSLRTTVWPSMFKRLAALWVGWMVAMAPLAAWWNQRDELGDIPFLFIPVIWLAIGALFFRSARRAWLNLELG